MAETTLNDTLHRDSFGAVEGAAEKLAKGHAARFALFPDDASRGVPVYVSGEDAVRLSRLCRKRVRVEGLLRRDSSTGAPLSIRDVTNIEVLEPPAAQPGDLWGILPTVDAVPALRECEARGFQQPALVDAPRMTTDTSHTLTVVGRATSRTE